MDVKYWQKYYKENPNPTNPTPFSIFVLDYLEQGKTLLELGCGNARDSVFFHENKIKTTAIDQVDSEIDYLQNKYGSNNIEFICDDFTKITKVTDSFDYIYSRFTLHSVTLEQEQTTLRWAKSHLLNDGLLFIELRSVKDELYKQGDKVIGQENAKITDHYRRFTEFDTLKSYLNEIGFDIIFELESNGLAVYGDRDPVIIRIVAKIKK